MLRAHLILAYANRARRKGSFMYSRAYHTPHTTHRHVIIVYIFLVIRYWLSAHIIEHASQTGWHITKTKKWTVFSSEYIFYGCINWHALFLWVVRSLCKYIYFLLSWCVRVRCFYYSIGAINLCSKWTETKSADSALQDSSFFRHMCVPVQRPYTPMFSHVEHLLCIHIKGAFTPFNLFITAFA